MDELKHTMRTGSLVKIAPSLSFRRFMTEEALSWEVGMEPLTHEQQFVTVTRFDIGLVVDDLLEEFEPYDLLVLFNERLVRADCRVLRRVK